MRHHLHCVRYARRIANGLLQARMLSAVTVCVATAAWPQSSMLERYARTSTVLPGSAVLVVGGLGIRYALVYRSGMYESVTDRSVTGHDTHERCSIYTATLLADGTMLLDDGFISPYSTLSTAELWMGEEYDLLRSHTSEQREGDGVPTSQHARHDCSTARDLPAILAHPA